SLYNQKPRLSTCGAACQSEPAANPQKREVQMEHFSEQVWADLVRGTGTSENLHLLELHLSDGCKECAATMQVWEQVREIGARESAYNPPQAAVRMAKLEFVASRLYEAREVVASLA